MLRDWRAWHLWPPGSRTAGQLDVQPSGLLGPADSEAVVEQAKDASQSGTGEECQRRPIVIAGFMVGQRGLSAAGPT